MAIDSFKANGSKVAGKLVGTSRDRNGRVKAEQQAKAASSNEESALNTAQTADVPMITIGEHEYNWLKSCEKAVQEFNATKHRTQEELRKKPMLQRANELICGDRQRDYGNKLQNFSQIAMLWQGTLAPKLQAAEKITPEEVALCMMQVKIARLSKSPDHADSILDIAGYAGCYDAVQLERKTGMTLMGATEDPRAKLNPFHNL